MKYKKNTFNTSVPHLITTNNDKLIFPFGPCMFQTELDNEILKKLILEGKKLTKENSNNYNLASNFKYGNTYKYKKDFTNEIGKNIIIPYGKEFVKNFNEIVNNKIKDKEMNLENLWINFSKKHDFNPSHIHEGFLSFVIYCHVPQNIFSVQAETNTPIAGKTIFEYGEKMSDINNCVYEIEPYDGLFLLFPSSLRHFVPPYWVDEERITVSGNVNLIS